MQHQLGHLVKDRYGYMENENVSEFWDLGGIWVPTQHAEGRMHEHERNQV